MRILGNTAELYRSSQLNLKNRIEMKRLLFTGFMPFRKYGVNPSEILANEVNGREFRETRIVSSVLPVTYKACRKFVTEKLSEDDYCAVIMTGLRARIRSIYLERIAINIENALTPDEDGITGQNRPIEPDGPDGLFSTLPITNLAGSLRSEGVPVRISNTAGTYVCNSLFYRTMLYHRNSGIPAGFIHIPPLIHPWSLDRFVSTFELILNDILS